MQFKVPQFLDIEDKIFGSFTFREFVYLAGGSGLCFVVYRLLGLFWGGIPILGVAGFSLALAFYKPNNKPFINMLEAGTKYLVQDKLYIWKKGSGSYKNLADSAKQKGNLVFGQDAKLTGSKLRDLAWSLDVLDLNKNQNS
ncbi:MAG: PrgI family protein [Candidatus Pacebacteria bacterium]|nr:PrgI family protein [Candidatus Paceibacterota bacterium]